MEGLIRKNRTSRFLNRILLGLVVLLLSAGQTLAQNKILAQYESKSSKGVSDATNVNSDDNSYAKVDAYGGAALGLGAYSGSIQMKFDQTVPANQWSYIRVDLDGGLIDALLGGSLGDALGGVLSTVLLGDLTIQVSALDSGTTVLSRKSGQGFGTDRVRLLTTGDGYALIALRPNKDYNQLKFKASSVVLAAGTVFHNKVYDAFTFEGSGGECGRPFATSFDGSGLDLSVLPVGDQHLDRAIDTDEETHSTLKKPTLLGLSVAGSLSQYFYFPTSSSENTSVNMKISLGSGGVLNTDLLGATQVIFYNGNDVVDKRALMSSLLNNTDVLNALGGGSSEVVTFAPGKPFDRIEVRLNSPVGVSLLGSALDIYDVQRYD
ncbi:MAG TPA: hypothetical protein VK084_10315, partial [Chitinophagaceae bacterium]|nr:hypothetical protein [Chitinophagaceae bacterium]